jgi:hypothetical protein
LIPQEVQKKIGWLQKAVEKLWSLPSGGSLTEQLVDLYHFVRS